MFPSSVTKIQNSQISEGCLKASTKYNGTFVQFRGKFLEQM